MKPSKEIDTHSNEQVIQQSNAYVLHPSGGRVNICPYGRVPNT